MSFQMSNCQINPTPQFRLFSSDQVYDLHLATLELLERTGVKCLEEESLNILMSAGAILNDDNRVKIPSHLIEEALRSVPKRVVLSNRDGNQTVFLEDEKVYFGTGSDCPQILDSYTGERRKFTKKDVSQAALLCDALSNIDFIMSLGIAQDTPPPVSDRHQFQAMLHNTKKPIVFTCHDREGLSDIIEMAKIVRENEDNLKANPFIALYAEPITPLVHPQKSLEKLLLAAEKFIPIIYTPAPMAGATAPVTLAGTIVTGNAELLSGLIIHQLKQKGAPFIYGGVFTIMDMSTSIFSYGSPEFYLLNAAMKDMARYYKLPIFSTAGCSDSKVLDQQAGIEAGMSVLLAALSGANLVHDVGYLEYGLLGSYEMVVMVDEIIDEVKRFMRGIEVNKETIALDVIRKVGPGGNFLQEEHTLKHFKHEQWFPKILNRQNYSKWSESGSQTLKDKLNQKVKQILESHQPEPLHKDKEKSIAGIIKKSEERLLT